MKSLFSIFTVLVMFFSVNAFASYEYKMSLAYMPKKDGCESISNTYLYVRKENKYRFKLAVDKSTFPANFWENKVLENERYAVRIYSVARLGIKENKADVIELKLNSNEYSEGVMINSVDRPMKCEGSNCNYLTRTFSLDVPDELDIDEVFYNENIDYYHWDILATLVDKRTNEVKSSSSFQLKILPKESTIINKIPGTTRYYSMHALPDSRLYDNYEGDEQYAIQYMIFDSKAKKSTKRMGAGVGLGVYFEPDVGVTFIDPLDLSTWTSDIFNSSYYDGLYDDFTWNVGLYLRTSKSRAISLKNKTAKDIKHNFILSPGESGIVFSQLHVEEADYEILGENRCGFLSKVGEDSFSVYQESYSLILVDREIVGHEMYLDQLADEQLPLYEYVNKEVNTKIKMNSLIIK